VIELRFTSYGLALHSPEEFPPSPHRMALPGPAGGVVSAGAVVERIGPGVDKMAADMAAHKQDMICTPFTEFVEGDAEAIRQAPL